MKKARIASIALLVSATSMTALPWSNAYASDLPRLPAVIQPAVPMPSYNWTGCYVGGNIGTAWDHPDITDSNAGFAGGVQIGCDYQVGSFVFGARNLIDATSLRGSSTFQSGVLTGYSGNSKSTWFDILTARAGYTVQPNWLVYAQSGFAWMSSSQWINNPAGAEVAHIGNRTGWTVGGGTEYMIAPRWTAFLEYNYMDFGTATANFTVGATPVSVDVKHNSQNLLIGFNYRF
jgi:outer membrane immunogenic protein